MLKLSCTSALVLLWAGQDCYPGGKAKAFLEQLDLAHGRPLYALCQAVWPHYAEVIKNRKFGVLDLIDRCLSGGSGDRQLVILGAGLDALGLAAAERHPQIGVFELDRENMPLKAALCAGIGGGTAGMSFLETDLQDERALAACLADAGWKRRKPTLLVVEGLSYYLSRETLAGLVQGLRPQEIIFEFLKHAEDIAPERAVIPDQVFGLISRQCALPEIGRFRISEIEKLSGMPVRIRYGMTDLEKMRTGANRYFPTEESGWIEVCLLARS